MKPINSKGQGLVELIVSIAVIEIGIFAVWSLFLVNFNAEREAQMRIVGVNLAREGVEIVKNIRDSNWLKNESNAADTVGEQVIWPWDQYLSAGTVTVNFDSESPEDISYNKSQLYTNSDGFYTNIAIDNKITPYKRLVTLGDIFCADDNQDFKCDDATFTKIESEAGAHPLKIGVNIISDVTWQIAQYNRHAIVEDNIFNWK